MLADNYGFDVILSDDLREIANAAKHPLEIHTADWNVAGERIISARPDDRLFHVTACFTPVGDKNGGCCTSRTRPDLAQKALGHKAFAEKHDAGEGCGDEISGKRPQHLA